MGWLRRPGAEAAIAEAPSAPPELEHSAPGLRQALDHLPRPGASVLDFGPALTANIELFRRIQARVRVLDFEGSLLEAKLWETPRKAIQWEGALDGALGLGAHERFDLVLAWDFPNYLGKERWAAVARRLVERLSPRGVLHLLVRSGKEMPARPSHFRITAGESIRESQRARDRLEPPRFSHGETERLHPGLGAARSFLDKHGLQEFLLERAETLNLPPRAVAQPRKPRSYYPG